VNRMTNAKVTLLLGLAVLCPVLGCSTDPPGNDGMAGISVSPTAGLLTSENGTTAEFAVVLDRQPIADVTITVNSSAPSECAVSPTTLTFTPANWNTPQTVTITGADDPLQDGDVAVTIVISAAVSADPAYNGLNPPDVSVTNTDNEARIIVQPTSGIVTTEAGGTAAFNVVLSDQPSADVTFDVTSSDTTECTVAPAALTFTPTNWNIAQTVTVTGVNDSDKDGDITVTIITSAAVSSDSRFGGLNVPDVTVTNQDDDSVEATLTIEPDDYAANTVLTNISPAVTLSIAREDNSINALAVVTATDDNQTYAPTGELVFGNYSTAYFNNKRRLRMDFAGRASSIQISFHAGTPYHTEIGVLQVFDSSGNQLAEYLTAPLRPDYGAVLMTITRTSADIAWAVAYTQGDVSFGRLDALVITVVGP